MQMMHDELHRKLHVRMRVLCHLAFITFKNVIYHSSSLVYKLTREIKKTFMPEEDKSINYFIKYSVGSVIV